MKQLSILSHPEFGAVRNTIIKGEPWFIAKDVCDILGHSNNRKAISDNVDIEDISDVTISDGSQNRQMTIINESGLYSLMLSSRLDKAKAFRRWITSEVLPSIRKNGYYIHPSMQLTTAQQRRLDRTMRELVKEYTTDRDIVRISKRCGRAVIYVRDVLRGYQQNNGVMDELQSQAIINKEQLESPYSTERLREVVKELSK